MKTNFIDSSRIAQSLKNWCKNLEYGTVIDEHKFSDESFDQDIIDNAHVLSDAEIMSYHIGTCYDIAGFIHRALTRNKIQHKCFLFSTRSNYDAEAGIWNDPTHTFVIWQDESGKWHWIEGSWKKYIDNTLCSDNPYKLTYMIKRLLDKENGNGFIREISYPKPGQTYHDFYKQLMTSCNHM